MSDDAPNQGALRITTDNPADLEQLRQLLGSLPETRARFRAAERVQGTLGGGELLEVVVGAAGGAPISAVLVAWINSKTTRIQLEVDGKKLKLSSRDNLEKVRPQVESLIAALDGAGAETRRPHSDPGCGAKPGPAPIPAPIPAPAQAPAQAQAQAPSVVPPQTSDGIDD